MTGSGAVHATTLRTVSTTPAIFTFDGREILKNVFFVVSSASLACLICNVFHTAIVVVHTERPGKQTVFEAQNPARKTVPTRENMVPTRCPHGAHYGAHYGAHCKNTHFSYFSHTRCVSHGEILH